MTKIIYTIAKLLTKARLLFLTISLSISIFFAFYATKIGFNFSPDNIFIDDDESYIFYQQTYLAHFAQSGTPGVIAIDSKDEGANLIAPLTALTKNLKKNPYVQQVLAPQEQEIIIPTKDGLKPFAAVNEKGQLSKIAKSYFQENPLYQGTFLSHDNKKLALMFILDASPNDAEKKALATESILNDLNEFAKHYPKISFHVTGISFIQHEMLSLLKSDQIRFVPLLALFLILLLMFMTKHPLGAIFPLLIISLALIWTVGFLAIVGHDINLVNHAIIILIMVIGIADAVHIYTRFVDESLLAYDKNPAFDKSTKEEVVIKTINAMLLPCFLTSATTSLGFVASSAAGVEIIKQFGIDAAIGVMFCFFNTFMVMPALLYMHPRPKGHHAVWFKWWPKKLTIHHMLSFLIKFSLRYRKSLAVISLLLLASSLWFSRNIASKQTWVGELPADNQAVIALNFMEQNFSGVMPFYIVLSGDEKKLKSFAAAKEVSQISDELRNNPLKPTIKSPFDAINYFLKKNPQPLSLNQIDEDTFNEIVLLMNQYSQGKSDIFSAFMSDDKKHLRLQGFLKNASTTKIEDFRSFVDEVLARHQIPGVSINVTGSALISSRALHNITKDMTKSLLLAVLYITLFVAIFFRSIRFAIIALLPNILPITITIACMSLLDIDVRLATVMIFSMALGLSIDTCVHLLSRVKEESQHINPRYQKLALIRSIHHAFIGSGRPIFYTIVILMGGFFIMTFSQFIALKDFAIISIIVLFAAFITDLVLLPALLLLTTRGIGKKKEL